MPEPSSHRVYAALPPTPAAIRLVEYDVDWPVRFQILARKVRAVLGDRAVRVEHIGSTSVPGLAAKPILDIDVVVAAAADVEPSIHRLESAGYRHEGDKGIPGRQAFRWPPGEPRHHLYLLVEGSRELQRHVALRDALRADRALRDQYAALKRALAQRFPNDRDAYTRGKDDFIHATLERLR